MIMLMWMMKVTEFLTSIQCSQKNYQYPHHFKYFITRTSEASSESNYIFPVKNWDTEKLDGSPHIFLCLSGLFKFTLVNMNF